VGGLLVDDAIDHFEDQGYQEGYRTLTPPHNRIDQALSQY
jgi:hypothetical protein